MPHYQAWEEFTRAAEKLYLADPMKVRVVLKYRHCDGNLCIKVTDDVASMESSNTSVFFMGVNITILGFYENKENEHYKNLEPSVYLKMLRGTTLVASAEVFREHLHTDVFTNCLLYRTDQAQDVKKIEKFHSQLMRLMVAKESRSAAMETD